MMRSQIINPTDESSDAGDVVSLELSGPLAAGFALARPVMVELFANNGEFVASTDELNIHAFGASREQVLCNLREWIVAQHQKLQAHGGRLGAAMKQVADRLSAIVVAEHA